MTRILSAVVLLPIVIGVIWFLPPVATLGLAGLAAALAFGEYAGIARALGANVPLAVPGAAVVAACVAVFAFESWLAVVLMTAVIAVGAMAVASGQPGPAILRDTTASLFPLLYIGLPLGALASIHRLAGAAALLLLVATIIISDSAQYYCGRTFGRRPLAPSISPKKTLEGAIGGILFGTLALTAGGRWLLPAAPLGLLAIAGATIAVLGIAGDLFESLLKRSAGVKDSSGLIPGHGGMLDRIDSWLFAGPVYYVLVRFLHS